MKSFIKQQTLITAIVINAKWDINTTRKFNQFAIDALYLSENFNVAQKNFVS
jgi:hypothetical protein